MNGFYFSYLFISHLSFFSLSPSSLLSFYLSVPLFSLFTIAYLNHFVPASKSSELSETMEFDLENPLTSISSSKDSDSTTTPLLLFSSESDHMPSPDFLKTSVSYALFRREAIRIVSQADYSDPFLPYLAVNYMDRFASRLENMENKPWVVRLVVISCLSLASKMRNSDFSASDFQQREGCFGFDEKTINRMEVMILHALQWRMRSITPFSFLEYFSLSFDTTASEQALKQRALKARAQDIIFKTQNEMKLLEFRPSAVAASALLAACQELFPLQFHSFERSISSCDCVNTDNLSRCLNHVQETIMCGCLTEDYTKSSIRRTPLSVLNWESTGGKSESESNSLSGTTIASDDVIGVARPIKRQKTDVNNMFL
ncbi:unnamed protein product [Linum tenue]|uniref:B-like cyclin n=1 Tax=Linum tenue TaxID=586396 RepID=A0AAV0LB82_9ROSI|nr:unnamed protein product [Linum tenue]